MHLNCITDAQLRRLTCVTCYMFTSSPAFLKIAAPAPHPSLYLHLYLHLCLSLSLGLGHQQADAVAVAAKQLAACSPRRAPHCAAASRHCWLNPCHSLSWRRHRVLEVASCWPLPPPPRADCFATAHVSRNQCTIASHLLCSLRAAAVPKAPTIEAVRQPALPGSWRSACRLAPVQNMGSIPGLLATHARASQLQSTRSRTRKEARAAPQEPSVVVALQGRSRVGSQCT